ncbi:MAG: hypothetical protein R2733_17200 [Acidimicrobiales bacterium]
MTDRRNSVGSCGALLAAAVVLLGTSCIGVEANTETDHAEAICDRVNQAADASVENGPNLVLSLDPNNYELVKDTPLGQAWEEARRVSELRQADPTNEDAFIGWLDAMVLASDECIRLLGP